LIIKRIINHSSQEEGARAKAVGAEIRRGRFQLLPRILRNFM
jgi:hypothetical protein